MLTNAQINRLKAAHQGAAHQFDALVREAEQTFRDYALFQRALSGQAEVHTSVGANGQVLVSFVMLPPDESSAALFRAISEHYPVAIPIDEPSLFGYLDEVNAPVEPARSDIVMKTDIVIGPQTDSGEIRSRIANGIFRRTTPIL